MDVVINLDEIHADGCLCALCCFQTRASPAPSPDAIPLQCVPSPDASLLQLVHVPPPDPDLQLQLVHVPGQGAELQLAPLLMERAADVHRKLRSTQQALRRSKS